MGIHGSGIAMMYKGRHFVVTAAHVNDGDMHTDQLLVGQSRDPHALASLPPKSIHTPMPATKDRRHDDFDLAVIPISRGLADGLRATGATFLGFDGVPLPEAAAGDELLFTGYPDKMQILFPLEDGLMQVEPLLSAVWLRQVSKAEAAGLHYPTDSHLVGRFRHAANRTLESLSGRGVLEDVHGMSGGAAWISVEGRMQFAGVVTKWLNDGNAGHLVATRSAFLTEMLDRAVATIADSN
jgi:hypothetical protein